MPFSIIFFNKNKYLFYNHSYIYYQIILVNIRITYKKYNIFFNYFFFNKLKFKGRFYYMLKTDKKNIHFFLDQSHNFIIYLPNIIFKIKKKKRLFLFGFNKKSIQSLKQIIKVFYKNNKFVKKGIQFHWEKRWYKVTNRTKYF